MAVVTATSLQSLIDEALDSCYRTMERPARIIMGSTALDDAADTTCTLSSGYATQVNVTDVLEYGQELLLVTAKSDDATPVFTVARGYLSTTAAGGVATGAALVLNPGFTRRDVARAVQRAFTGPLASGLPYLKMSAVLTVDPDSSMVEVPADVVKPLRIVSGYDGTTILEHGQFEFFERLPVALSSTGVAIKLPRSFSDPYDDIYMEYEAAYPWTGSGESATVPLYHGSEDIPSLYATAFLLGGREYARLELEKVEEWAQDAAIRQGVSLRLVQQLWTQFYRRLDEARRVRPVTHQRRPYRRMRKAE